MPVPRQATGVVEEHPWKDGRTVTFRARVPYKSRRPRVTFGTNHEGWNRHRADVELERIMAQIQRGTWQPPDEAPPAAGEVEPPKSSETIHVTISRWWQAKKPNLGPNAQADYTWRYEHILAFRHDTPTAAIDAEWVDELRDHLARQPARNRRYGSAKTLSPTSVNKVLEVLAQVLDLAVDYGQLDSNPARGRRRRMATKKSRRPWLEPDMVVDLLDVAGEWEEELRDRKRPYECYGRRELLALLCLGGGARISEAISANRGEFDLAGGAWRIPDSKTEAGERIVDLSCFLAEELRSHVAASPSRSRKIKSRGPMFPTRKGTQLSQENVRRMLREVVRRTNERRAEEDKMLLPEITPHSLRVTFASLCFLAGRDPAWVMGQIGHKDARLTLEVYTRTMQRKNVDRQLVWRLMRFADESEEWPGVQPNRPTNRPSAQGLSSGGDARMRRA